MNYEQIQQSITDSIINAGKGEITGPVLGRQLNTIIDMQHKQEAAIIFIGFLCAFAVIALAAFAVCLRNEIKSIKN